MPIHIKLEKFEGPLGLLLELIQAEKLEISEISLAQVTDQYLTYLREAKDIPHRHLADFLVVASQLLLIKSRLLLPALKLSKEEEGEIRNLELALREYQRYKEASRFLKKLVEGERFVLTRQLWQGAAGGFFPPKNISPALLQRAVRATISTLTQFLQPLDKAVVKRVQSVESKIKEILKRIEKRATFTLREVVPGGQKPDLILAFLAILFLFKEKLIHIAQTGPFSEIRVTRNEIK